MARLSWLAWVSPDLTGLLWFDLFCKLRSLAVMLIIIIIIIIIITEREFDLRGTVTLLLQDHCTMLP